MKNSAVILLAFILLQCASCVKKVTPTIEPEYFELGSTNCYLLPNQNNGYRCRGISLDGDTSEDFRICSFYYSGGQSRQSTLSAEALHGTILEVANDRSNLVKCVSSGQPLRIRKSGETVVTADTSNITKSAIYDYYVGPGAQGIAIQGNCSFRALPADSLYYIIVRKVEGTAMSIGFLEVKKNKITRFRKFRKQDQLILPN